MPPTVRNRGRFLRKLVLGAGWLAFVLVLALTVFERSGWLAEMLRKELRGHLGALPLKLEGARLAWFDTRVDLLGLHVGEGEGSVHVDKLEVHWGFGLQEGFAIRALVLRGGRARITPDFVNALETRVGDGPGTSGGFTLPPLVVRDMKVEVLSERWQGFGLGSVDLRAQGKNGGIEAEGALHLNVGEVYLHGSLSAERQLRLETLATGLPVSQAYLPPSAKHFQPLGSLALEGHVGADLRPDGRASGTLRLSLSEASFMVAGGKQRVDDFSLDFDGHIETDNVGSALDPASWECALKTSGTWERHHFEGWGFLGPALAAGARARGFVYIPGMPFDGSIAELISANAEDHAKLESRRKAFTPIGEGELWASFELPEPPPGVPVALSDLRVCAELRLDGKAGLTYLGWPQAGGERDAGFPLPIDSVHGSVVFGRDPRAKRPNLLGIDLSGSTVCGPMRAQGLVHSHASDDPPLMPGYGSSEFDLHFRADKLVHNALFDEALAGLGQAVPAESTWRPYQPQGGTLGIDLRLVRKVDMPFAACDLALELEGLGLRWKDLPVPLSGAHGELQFRSDGKGERGLAARFEAQLPSTAATLALKLRFQTDPSEPRGTESKPFDQLSCVEARIGGLSLTGDEKQVLVEHYSELAAALKRVSPRGVADLELQRVQSGAAAPARWRGEITPRDVLLQPENFRVNTSKVRGRVILTVEEPRDPSLPTVLETALAPLIGVSPGIDQLAFAGRLPGAFVDLWAAGIHPDDKNVRGALGEGTNKFDMSGFGLLGPLDLSGRILLAAAQEEGFGLEAQIFLRDNTFRTEPHTLVLSDLRGRLDLKGGVLRGPELHAVLGRTAVVLRNLEFSTPKDEFRLALELESRGLPLDRDHLSGFVDEKTLAALLDEMQLAGRLDVEHGQIEIKGHSASDSQIVFRGEVLLQQSSVQLGLPWVIHSARASIDPLRLEGGRLRAVARVRDLEGTLAGRALSHGNMLLTYIEPQLSIEDLDAELEGGKLSSLGVGAQRSGTALSIGLEAPYVFQLALDFVGVDIGRLLRGMFDSDFAAKGSLNAQLRLRGNTERVLDVEGSGSVDVSKSRLWSIPVFRELFSQIGLNSAAVFDRMFANLHVHAGRLELSDIAVNSPVVMLRGEHGWIDGNGDMHFDLELRYDTVDKLGYLARLIYWIQNRLLSVSIRGDMARPSVVLKNPISGLFGGGKHKRALPLPPFTPLPARF